MSNFETIKEDLLAFSDASKEFIGAFIYEPMGIESTPMINGLTLYILLGVVGMTLYRASRPARKIRYRKPVEYHYGRNV